jgi:hypothetical protein
LGEDHVKGCALDGIRETDIRNLALGSRGDEKAGLDGLELVHEVGVVGLDIIRARYIAHFSFEVKVETIDERVAKRTGSILGSPLGCDGSESSHEELGIVLSHCLGGKVVCCWRTSAERKQDLLAVLLAELDATLDAGASLQHLLILGGIGRMLVVVVACIAEVGSWPVSLFGRESIHETNVDHIDGIISTGGSERGLVGSLSPVHGNIRGRASIESCVCGRGKERHRNGGTRKGGSRHDYGIRE